MPVQLPEAVHADQQIHLEFNGLSKTDISIEQKPLYFVVVVDIFGLSTLVVDLHTNENL